VSIKLPQQYNIVGYTMPTIFTGVSLFELPILPLWKRISTSGKAKKTKGMRTMKGRQHQNISQSMSQILTRAVTHIRLEAVNAGKFAALNDLAQVYLPLC